MSSSIEIEFKLTNGILVEFVLFFFSFLWIEWKVKVYGIENNEFKNRFKFQQIFCPSADFFLHQI